MKTTEKLTPTSHKQTEATADVIKLGIDIHKMKYVVIRQIDNQAPQSPQTFGPDEFLVWVQRQRLQAKRVASWYDTKTSVTVNTRTSVTLNWHLCHGKQLIR